MTIDEVEAKLVEIARAHCASLDAPTLTEAWSAFKEVLRTEFHGTGGLLLLESGIDRKSRYYLHFLRMFKFETDPWEDCVFDVTFEYVSITGLPTVSQEEADLTPESAERFIDEVEGYHQIWGGLRSVPPATVILHIGRN